MRDLLAIVAAFVLMVGAVGCAKREGDAVVVSKHRLQTMEVDLEENENAPSSGGSQVTDRWVITVKTMIDQRQLEIDVDKARWDKLKEGDHVTVTSRGPAPQR